MICTVRSKVYLHLHDRWLLQLTPDCPECQDIEQVTVLTKTEPPVDTYDLHLQRVVPA